MNTSRRGGDYNAKGRYYEVLFKAECLKRKLEVLSPECTHLPFDVAIYAAGKFLRIQIKGTSTLQVRPKRNGIDRFYRFNTMNGRKQHYRDMGIDFIAGFVEPMGSWYIIPAAEITSPSIEIRRNSVGRAASYKGRWDMLDPRLANEPEVKWAFDIPDPLPDRNQFDAGIRLEPVVTDRRSIGRVAVNTDTITGASGLNGNKVEK